MNMGVGSIVGIIFLAAGVLLLLFFVIKAVASPKKIEGLQKLVKQGKIVPKTPIEKTITAAHGHPDSTVTQAARRMAEKRGIDWRTGKKLKK